MAGFSPAFFVQASGQLRRRINIEGIRKRPLSSWDSTLKITLQILVAVDTLF